MTRRPFRSRARRSVAPILAATLALGLAACTTEPPEPDPRLQKHKPTPTPTDPPEDVALRVGVYGSEREAAVFTSLARQFAAERDGVTVDVASWRDHDEALQNYRDGSPLPDLFMVSRADLPWLQDEQRTTPVDQLLDARGVSFSETYARDSMEAFASNNGLACLPYAISPMVVYVNTDLVDFERMRNRELAVPEDLTRWSWEQFEAAARFAARPRKGTWGVYVEPTLRQLSPFVQAGGGEVFDDAREPTSLDFSSEDTREALGRVLPVLRDPKLTPSPDQLGGRTGLDLFEQGKVGMIVGFRSLTPPLRESTDLDFDVMPMPSIARSQTSGEFLGICMSATTPDRNLAADLMMALFSTEAVGRLAEEGYLVPANVSVAKSDDFLQEGRQPANAVVFTSTLRTIVFPPLIDSWADLEASVATELEELLNEPLLDLPELTERIDEDSREVLSPPEEGETEPSESASP